MPGWSGSSPTAFTGWPVQAWAAEGWVAWGMQPGCNRSGKLCTVIWRQAATLVSVEEAGKH